MTTSELILGTSIAPRRLDVQLTTIGSWMRGGISVVSFNCQNEIDKLKPLFPGVRFVRVHRDGRERFGRPLVYVDDVLDWFAQQPGTVGGFVNSDILLQGVDPARLRDLILRHASGSLIYGRRINLREFTDVEGPVARFCFDFFAFDTSILSIYPRKNEYFIGFCHWDYFMILLPLVNQVPLKELAFPFAFHKNHNQTYDWDRDIIPAALRTFHYMWPHLDSMCEMDWYLGPVVKQLFADRPKTLRTDDDITRFRTLQSAMDRLLLSNVEWMTEKLFLNEQPSLKYGPPGIYVNPTHAGPD